MSLCRNRNPYDDESFNNPDKINLNDNQSNKLSAGSLRRTKKNKTRMPKDFVFNEEEELKLSQLKKKNSLLDLTDSEEDKEKDININSENSIEKDGEKDKDKIVEIINTDLPNKDIKNEEMKNEKNKNEEEKEKEKENESEKKEEKNEEDIKIEDMENNKEKIINNSEDKNIDDKDITNGIKEEHIEKEENKKEENKKEENIINEEEKKENKVEKEIDNKKENIEEKNDDIENKEKKEEKEIKEEHVEKDEENIEINKKDEQKTEENVEKEEENIQKNKNEEEKDNNEIKQEIKEEKKEKLLSEIINNVEEGKEDKELLRTKPNPNLKEDKKEKEEEYLDEEEEEEEEDDDEDDKNKKEEPKNESTDLEIKDLSKYETLIKIININLESFGYSKIDIKKEIDNLYGAFSDKTSSDDLVSNLSEKLIKLMEVSQENDKTELKNFINTLVNFYKGNKDEVYKQLMEYTEKIIDQDQLTTRRMNRGIRSNIQECKDKLKDRLKKEDIPSDKIITIEKFEKIVEETELQMKDNHMDVLLYQMKKKVPKGRNFNTLNAIVIVDFLK